MSLEALIFVLFVVWCCIAVFVSSHANENGKSGWWGLVVLIFGLFGLVGYAISLASD